MQHTVYHPPGVQEISSIKCRSG